ncbi:MAG: porin [Variovorax sp.]|nr:MAG: porin [Variovorax sp.]
MKKSLVALAALAAAGVASAQSSVTLFGIVDAAISYQSTTSNYTEIVPTVVVNPFTGVPTVLGVAQTFSGKQSNWAMRNSGYNSSRLGFRGTEDLGGGLAASFWLEAPISNDDGATGVASFQRRSTVSLSGGFGEIRLGRDYTPTFWNDTVFDPFGTNGSGTNLISTVGGSAGIGNGNYVRASNTVGYFLPKNLGGFYGQVQYGLHENVKSEVGGVTENTANGRYIGGRFGYANGPLDIAVAYGRSTLADSETTIVSPFFPGGEYNTRVLNRAETANLGASYDFGVVKLFGEVSQVRNKFKAVNDLDGTASVTDKYNGYLLGVTAPVGAGLIRASYSHVKYKEGGLVPLSPFGFGAGNYNEPKANKLAIGYVHNLSKRTALYATAAYTRNKNDVNYLGGLVANSTNNYGNAGGAAKNPGFIAGDLPRKAVGYDFGIRHSF